MNPTLLAALCLLASPVSPADDVNRNSSESRDRPHLIVTGTVESIEEVKKEDGGAALMKAVLKIGAVERRRDLAAKPGGDPVTLFCRPYLSRRKLEGKDVIHLEFEDDVTRIGKPPE